LVDAFPAPGDVYVAFFIGESSLVLQEFLFNRRELLVRPLRLGRRATPPGYR
jgi:hypothetical protein